MNKKGSKASYITIHSFIHWGANTHSVVARDEETESRRRRRRRKSAAAMMFAAAAAASRNGASSFCMLASSFSSSKARFQRCYPKHHRFWCCSAFVSSRSVARGQRRRLHWGVRRASDDGSSPPPPSPVGSSSGAKEDFEQNDDFNNNDAQQQHDQGATPWDPAEHDGELDPIRNEVLLQIVQSELSDEEVNKLVWQCLGYEMTIDLDPETLTATEKWSVSDKVFPNWAKRFPEPPDVIGVTRKYYPEIDQPVKEACASLTRSVASEYKNGLKEQLRPLGWKGFKMEGLTPNMTRRAQAANWLVYYRSELRGVSIEELKRRREVRRLKEIEDGEEKKPTGGSAQSVV